MENKTHPSLVGKTLKTLSFLSQQGGLGRGGIRSVEISECGNWGVSKMRSVENEKC